MDDRQRRRITRNTVQRYAPLLVIGETALKGISDRFKRQSARTDNGFARRLDSVRSTGLRTDTIERKKTSCFTQNRLNLNSTYHRS